MVFESINTSVAPPSDVDAGKNERRVDADDIVARDTDTGSAVDRDTTLNRVAGEDDVAAAPDRDGRKQFPGTRPGAI